LDTWDDGATYEPYVGRWSRQIARHFLTWVRVSRQSAWLDVGCGTGALSQTILADADPRLVIGCDRSPGYVAFATQQVHDARARFEVCAVPDLPRVPGGWDAVVSGLLLNFLPVPLDGVTAMAARARPGGTVAAYVWDYAEGMELMRFFWDAAVELDDAARRLDEGARFPLCRPDPLKQLFVSAGLRDVEVRPIDVPTVFRNFDDFWMPFLGGQGPAPGYAMSLTSPQRERLRDLIRERLPSPPDGTIVLKARAWAVRGHAG